MRNKKYLVNFTEKTLKVSLVRIQSSTTRILKTENKKPMKTKSQIQNVLKIKITKISLVGLNYKLPFL